MKRYLTIKYTKPIPVEFKEGIDLLNALANYIEVYGDCFIGLFEDYDDAIEQQDLHYLLFGDMDICKDLNTLHYLEDCYQLKIDTNI